MTLLWTHQWLLFTYSSIWDWYHYCAWLSLQGTQIFLFSYIFLGILVVLTLFVGVILTNFQKNKVQTSTPACPSCINSSVPTGNCSAYGRPETMAWSQETSPASPAFNSATAARWMELWLSLDKSVLVDQSGFVENSPWRAWLYDKLQTRVYKWTFVTLIFLQSLTLAVPVSSCVLLLCVVFMCHWLFQWMTLGVEAPTSETKTIQHAYMTIGAFFILVFVLEVCVILHEYSSLCCTEQWVCGYLTVTEWWTHWNTDEWVARWVGRMDE